VLEGLLMRWLLWTIWYTGLIIFCIFLFLSKCFPQKNEYYITREINIKGLAQSSVYDILQDNEGFMWFGTGEGLNRYDGYSYTRFRFDNYDSTTISDNSINDLFMDRNNNIWISTHNEGLDKYDRSTNKFIRYKHNDNNPKSISSNTVFFVTEDIDGMLWIATENGINKFNRKNQTFTHYNISIKGINEDNLNYTTNLFEDSKGILWIGTEKAGLIRFDKEKNKYENYKHDLKDSKSLSNNYIWNIVEDPNDKNILWIGTDKGINRFDKNKRTFSCALEGINNQNDLIRNPISSLLFDRNGNFWIGTYGHGLYKYDPRHKDLSHFIYDRNNPNTIGSNVIVSLYEDKSGIIWAGTRGGGLSKLKPYKFAQYKILSPSLDEININNVWSLLKDHEGKIWIGTDNGLVILNRSTGKYSIYQNNPKNPYSISDNSITAICEDKNFDMWIGTQNGGLNKFIKSNHSFISFKNDPKNSKSIPYNHVKSILEDSDGILWIGTRGGGFARFDRRNNSFKCYRMTNAKNSLSHDRVNYIFEDTNHDLWICTSGGGINKFNKKTETFTNYTFDLKNPNSLSDIYVMCVDEDSEGNLWICTYDGGINKFDRRTGKFIHFKQENGLPSNVAYGVLIDKNDNLWISSNNGLSRFNPKTLSFRNYDEQDGLQTKDFNSGSFYLSKDGEMFFGGINGFNSFYSESISENIYNPPIVISGFKIFDKEISLDKLLASSKEINLLYKDNFFSFEFSSLDYSAPEKIQYAYKLEGFDKDWIKSDNRRYASYTNLDDGEYIFKVMGTNSDGTWNKNYAKLKVIISPPYWRTWWFRILIILITSYIIVYLYKRRIRLLENYNASLKKEINEKLIIEKELIKAKEKAEESDRLKSNFLAQMSHEIRTPINTILSFTSLLKEEVNDKVDKDLKESFSIIESGGRRLIRTIDMILKMSEIQAGKLDVHLQEVDILNDVLNNLVNELRFLAERKKLELNIKCNAERTKIFADKYSVTKIFQNLIDNAIKYTEKGSIDLNIYNNGNNQLYVEVKDTGIGMSKDYLSNLFKPFSQEDSGYTRRFEGNGLGLSLVKNYIEINKASIDVDSEKWKGTKVTVIFTNTQKYFS
jgi:two-component system, sensor histidine kinase ChiS